MASTATLLCFLGGSDGTCGWRRGRPLRSGDRGSTRAAPAVRGRIPATRPNRSWSRSWCPSTTRRPNLETSITQSAPVPGRVVPVPNHGHDRRQRQHRRHRAGRPAVGVDDPGVQGPDPRPQGPRLRAPHGLVSQRGRGGGLHGRRPLHLSLRPAAPCRVGALRPQRPGGRHPVGPRVPGSYAGPNASSSHVATATSSGSRCAAGSPTSSAASRRSGATCAVQILPLVDDNEWFFDTELIVTAERLGVRISETPVDWTDDPTRRWTSSTPPWTTSRGIWRMTRAAESRAHQPSGPRRRRKRVRPRPISCCPSPGWAC